MMCVCACSSYFWLLTTWYVPAGNEAAVELNIQLHFFKISYLIKEALIKNEVDVGLLIELLCATSAVKNKQIPIFDKEVSEKIRSIDEF